MQAAPLHRRADRAVWDYASWILATLLVEAMRYDFQLSHVYWSAVIAYFLLACILQSIIGTLYKFYRAQNSAARSDESLGIAVAVFTPAVMFGVVFVGPVGSDPIPTVTAVLTPPAVLLFMFAGRCLHRAWTGGPGAIVSGDREMHDAVPVGAGATIWQVLDAGRRSTVGAAARVVRDVRPGSIVKGVLPR